VAGNCCSCIYNYFRDYLDRILEIIEMILDMIIEGAKAVFSKRKGKQSILNMTAEDLDRDVENVGRLPCKSEVQGSAGLLLGTVEI
jgi:hypothetical protein